MMITGMASCFHDYTDYAHLICVRSILVLFRYIFLAFTKNSVLAIRRTSLL